jgi:hypothetical protein
MTSLPAALGCGGFLDFRRRRFFFAFVVRCARETNFYFNALHNFQAPVFSSPSLSLSLSLSLSPFLSVAFMTDYPTSTIDELRHLLSERHLEVKGAKSTLVSRLRDSDANQRRARSPLSEFVPESVIRKNVSHLLASLSLTHTPSILRRHRWCVPKR